MVGWDEERSASLGLSFLSCCSASQDGESCEPMDGRRGRGKRAPVRQSGAISRIEVGLVIEWEWVHRGFTGLENFQVGFCQVA